MPYNLIRVGVLWNKKSIKNNICLLKHTSKHVLWILKEVISNHLFSNVTFVDYFRKNYTPEFILNEINQKKVDLFNIAVCPYHDQSPYELIELSPPICAESIKLFQFVNRNSKANCKKTSSSFSFITQSPTSIQIALFLFVISVCILISCVQLWHFGRGRSACRRLRIIFHSIIHGLAICLAQTYFCNRTRMIQHSASRLITFACLIEAAQLSKVITSFIETLSVLLDFSQLITNVQQLHFRQLPIFWISQHETQLFANSNDGSLQKHLYIQSCLKESKSKCNIVHYVRQLFRIAHVEQVMIARESTGTQLVQYFLKKSPTHFIWINPNPVMELNRMLPYHRMLSKDIKQRIVHFAHRLLQSAYIDHFSNGMQSTIESNLTDSIVSELSTYKQRNANFNSLKIDSFAHLLSAFFIMQTFVLICFYIQRLAFLH